MAEFIRCKHGISGRGGDFSGTGTKRHYPPNLEVEPIHREIHLDLNIPDATCRGKVVTTVQGKHGSAQKLSLNAVDFEAVEVTDTGGQGLTWRYDGRLIDITWDAPFTQGETRQVEVRYILNQPSTGLFFSSPDDTYPNRQCFAATDNESERARHWLPCIDLPNVRTTLDYHITADASLTILANGSLVDETATTDGRKTAHWTLKERCPSYLCCVAVGEFTRADDRAVEGVSISYFGASEFSEADLVRSFGRTPDIMEWMTRKLDHPFPYPKYYQFAVHGIGGAMENISLTSWDDKFVMDDALASEWTLLVDQINVHEMAHSYFGDLIVCRDFAHAWLKESWATYIETCYFQDCVSKDQGDLDYYTNANAYFSEADGEYKRPVVTREFATSWQMYDQHLYPGGACRLHTLRHELGNDVFWKAVQAYVKRFAHQVVETDDFRRVMEDVSGRSLGAFFDQWFFSKGYPDLKVSFSYDKETQLGTFDVEQKQVDEKANIEAFTLPMTFGWVVDGQLKTTTVRLDQAKQVVAIQMDDEPSQVRLDPHQHVLHKLSFNPGDDKLVEQLTQAEDIVGRIQAGRELADTGKLKNIRAIGDAYEKEPFFGVRLWWAHALGKAGTQSAIDVLIDCLARETDPKVLASLMRAAAQYRDGALSQAIEDRIDGGLPHLAHQAALEALGAQRDGAPFERLAGAATAEGFGGWAQTGAIRALAATHLKEASGHLLDLIGYGAIPERVRPHAVRALSIAATRQSDGLKARVREELENLLRDPSHLVQAAAMTALENLADPRAISALDKYKRTLSDQEQVRVQSAIESLRRSAKPSAGAKPKEFEKLQELVRTLREDLQKLEAKFDAKK
jgi:aminopeptidase N